MCGDRRVISWDRVFFKKLTVAQLVKIGFSFFQVLRICTAVKKTLLQFFPETVFTGGPVWPSQSNRGF
jgi:hypothetical protein